MRRRRRHEQEPQDDRETQAGDPWDHTEVALSARRLLELVRPALRLVWTASPAETINLFVMQTLAGLALPLQVLAGKWALDAIFAASRADAGLESALPAVAIALAAMTAGQVLTAVARHRARLLPRSRRRRRRRCWPPRPSRSTSRRSRRPPSTIAWCAPSTRPPTAPRTW